MSKPSSSPEKSERRALFRSGITLFAIFFCPVSAGGQSGVIKGEVEFPDRGLDVASFYEETVVQIRPEPATPSAAPHPAAGTAILEVRHEAFSPRVLAVAVGTKVAFVNRDRNIHNIFSVSPVRKFDLGMISAGEKGDVVFDQPGVVHLQCKTEPPMEGFVVVVSGTYFARANERAMYEISGLSPGSYVAQAWNPHYEPETTPLSIRRDGEVVSADFRFSKRRAVPWP